MRLVFSGGGTGGHVYPALEVCRIAQEEADLLYIGHADYVAAKQRARAAAKLPPA